MTPKHQKSDLLRDILKYSKAKGADRLVLLVLAEFSDWANTGMQMADIAAYSCLSIRQAQRAIKSLLNQGYLTKTPGNGRGHVTSYHINVTPWKGHGLKLG
jgi:MarR-like DNA-binding transcriptional regulator SgrR of sgrS sRNA